MPIELILDSLDGVGDDIKPFYVESEGKFLLDPDKYAEGKAKGVKAKNSDLVKRLQKAQDATKRFESLAELDDEELQALVEHHKNGAGTNGGGGQPDAAAVKAEIDKATAKLLKKHETEKSALTTDNEALKKKVKFYELTVPLRELALKAGIIPDRMDYVMFDTSRYFKLDDSGKIVVLDEDGDPSDLPAQKFFAEVYKERNPWLYSATGTGGSGATNNQSGGTGKKMKTVKRAEWDRMDTAERTEFSKAGGKVTD